MSRKRDRSKEHSSPSLITLQRRNCKLILKYSELYRNRAQYLVLPARVLAIATSGLL